MRAYFIFVLTNFIFVLTNFIFVYKQDNSIELLKVFIVK